MRLSVVVAVGIWWIANTVSHQFNHRPFFRQRWANACVGRCLTLLIGVPQAVSRERHLAHHGGIPFRLRWSPAVVADVAVAAGIWTGLALGAPVFFAEIYLPGFGTARVLCAIP